MQVPEEFVQIDGFPNYFVSNYGRVVNARYDRELTPNLDKNGYMRVCLSRHGEPYFFMVHRLVAAYFLDDYDEEIEVKHHNGDLTDCGILNLYMGEKGARQREKELPR